MKKTIFVLAIILSFAFEMMPREVEMLTRIRNGRDRTEVPVEPQVNYDDESNTVELAIEADNFFTMEVLDIYGTKVYSCPVMMVDGTPTNYVLPQLPAGIYTLKVESDDVSYEGTLVIE